tara:strand:+ start:13269 stop:13682 length:414 start_codon:yes stop_codon:yes gene_type:complete
MIEKKNFWVIDDDPVFQMIIQKLLMRIDFCGNVETSKNGMEAAAKMLEALESESSLPDFIFLDINMPIMDGWQFLERFTEPLKESQRIPAIFIVTSSIDESDREKAKSHPLVQGYITKPVKLEFLQSLRPESGPLKL